MIAGESAPGSQVTARGFLLHPTYRTLSGRPAVHLYGVLEDGQTFLARDDRQVPHFFVERRHREGARALGAKPLDETDLLTLQGEPVLRVEVMMPADAPPLRDRLIRSGVPCYEADVRFALRYLIDRGVRGALRLTGRPRPGAKLPVAPRVDWIFSNPEIAFDDLIPRLRVLSFDIETSRGGEVLAVALFGCGASEVLVVPPAGAAAVGAPGVAIASEAELLRRFVRRVQELDPDVLTGWNVIQFDLVVLERRARALGVRLELGRAPGRIRIDPQTTRAGARATVTGRMVLDGPQVLRGAFVRLDDYSLDAVARRFLGEGKTLQGAGRVEEIWRRYREDLPGFVAYAMTDARLALEVLERLQLVQLSVERSLLTGMPLDRVHASVAAFDYLYLSELRNRRRVAPTVAGSEPRPVVAGGGHVLAPVPGLHRNVLVFDFKSLYPSLIRSFQIDPLGHLPHWRDGDEGDPIVAPNGAAFRREPGILTQLLDPLFARREVAKRTGDRVASQAIKILMNSFYGVLGTSVCRFASSEIATAITSFGREMLLFTKGEIEAAGYRVLYGDTDSLFVDSGEMEPAPARRLGERLVEHLNEALQAHVARTWRVQSRLELELERLYARLLLPEMRHGRGGARKRYAGLVDDGGRQEVVFTGLEAVRRDWTELAHRVQRDLYERLFRDRPVEEYLRRTIETLKTGAYDEHLTYRKGLGKPLEAYTETTPPHVVAARKRSRPPRRRIAYVWTIAGPEPADERTSPFDYEHYVDKQIRPVAEPVLRVLEHDFDELVGGVRQLKLF